MPLSTTVVIPVFNGADHILQAIESVIGQSQPAEEIVVVDDGSTDGTRDVLSAFEPYVTVVHSQNRGASSARNIGVRESHGDVIMFLDADDLWCPDKISDQIAILDQNPSVDAVFSSFQTKSNVSQLLKEVVVNPLIVADCRMPNATEALLETNFPGTCSVAAVRRSVFKAVGGFDTTLRQAEDYDLWLKISLVGQVWFCSKRHAVKLEHDANLTSNWTETMQCHLRVINRFPETARRFTGREFSDPIVYQRGLRIATIQLIDTLSREGADLEALQTAFAQAFISPRLFIGIIPSLLRALARLLRRQFTISKCTPSHFESSNFRSAVKEL